MTPAPARPQNVLLIHCHDLGRFLGAYGVETVSTPRLDALAADSVVFERAFSAAPQCSPARAALFTGTYPQRNGVLGLTHAPFSWDLNDPSSHIASRLRSEGMRTQLIGVQHESLVLDDVTVASRLGFDVVQSHGAGGVQSDSSGDLVAARTIDALTEYAEAGEPFYLQVGFYEPHRIPSPDDAPGVMGFLGGYIDPHSELGHTVPPYLTDDERARTEIAELQGAVRYMDAHVGRVLDAVDELGLTDSTIVVFTTDHGLALPRAKGTLYDAGLGVALMIRAPRRPGWGGTRVESLVSHLDVRPTLLELLGLPFDSDADGTSLAPLVDGPAAETRLMYGQLTYHDYYSPKRSVRSDRYKLIINFANAPTPMDPSQSWFRRSAPRDLSGGGIRTNALVELYNLEADPDEHVNLASDEAYRLVSDELARAMLAWMRDVDDPLLAAGPRSPLHEAALRFLESADAARTPERDIQTA